MRKNLLISTVSAFVLLSANSAFSSITEIDWDGLKKSVKTQDETVVLGADIEISQEGTAMEEYASGVVINGDKHTISATESPEGTTSADFRFIYNRTNADTPLVINDLNFKGGHIITSGDTVAFGGAIHNKGTNSKIGKITGNFEGNYAKGDSYVYGGAIYNQGTIGDKNGGIAGNFINNSTLSTGSYARGGAIYNNGASSNIGNITGKFEGNNVSGEYAYGGAIYNEGKIGDIGSNYEGNYAIANSSARGGAIYNSGNGTIGNENGGIKGNFNNNKVQSGTSFARGGAIFNQGIIGNKNGKIEGNFISNNAQSTSSTAFGGAIYNEGENAKIASIEGNFEDNKVKGGLLARGGAIYNLGGTIGNEQSGIKGYFKNNNAQSVNSSVYGGAIYNEGTQAYIGNIEGDFEANSAQGHSYAYGGAIYNQGTIGSEKSAIVGNFINNSALSADSYAKGGALYNHGTNSNIGNIAGKFEGNNVSGEYAYGGAIYNEGKIGDIDGYYEGNYATSNLAARGGAIYNGNGTIGNENGTIKGYFKNNNAQSTNSSVYGGAIYNESTTAKISNIEGDFEANSAQGYSYAYGGAIYNQGTIGNENGTIKGNFINNKVQSSNLNARGGAIYNEGTDAKIVNIDGYFDGNSAQGYSSAYGGAIYNQGTIGNEKGSFTGNFINNNAQSIDSHARGGAIYNMGTIHLVNLSFYDNYVSGNAQSRGGAIYNEGELTITADNGISEFKGNKVKTGNAAEKAEALFIKGDYSDNITTVTLNAVNNGLIKFDDAIHALTNQKQILEAWYGNDSVTVKSDDAGGYYLNNKDTGDNYGHIIKEGDTYLNPDAGIFTIAEDKLAEELSSHSEDKGYQIVQDGDNYTIRGTQESDDPLYYEFIKKVEDGYTIESGHVVKFGFNGGLLLTGDATSKIEFNNEIRNLKITSSAANVEVSEGSFLNFENALELNGGKFTIKDLGAENLHFSGLALNDGTLNLNSVTVDLAELSMGRITADEAVEGKAKINVNGLLLTTDGQEGDNVILFADENLKGSVNNNIAEATAPVYTYSVRYDPATGNFIFTRGFPIEEGNYELYNPGTFVPDIFSESSLNMQNAALLQVTDQPLDYTKGRVWAMPFYSDDTIEYKDFYDVDSKNYGVIAGIDSKPYGEDTKYVYTIFGAYNDGENKFEGIKVDSQSWLAGLKVSAYNPNGLYGDAIVNIAKHDMDADTYFGNDSYDTIGYGAALKGGYKHNFENKVSLDTSALLNWQQVQGKDFTSASGLAMETDDYSRLSLTPQIKVGYQLENIKPYALARYHFVLNEDGSSVAAGVDLPEVESKGYAEYGIGFETTTNPVHNGFAHILRHTAGRDGWSITAGYTYNF